MTSRALEELRGEAAIISRMGALELMSKSHALPRLVALIFAVLDDFDRRLERLEETSHG